jgi:hypothetical protein
MHGFSATEHQQHGDWLFQGYMPGQLQTGCGSNTQVALLFMKGIACSSRRKYAAAVFLSILL